MELKAITEDNVLAPPLRFDEDFKTAFVGDIMMRREHEQKVETKLDGIVKEFEKLNSNLSGLKNSISMLKKR